MLNGGLDVFAGIDDDEEVGVEVPNSQLNACKLWSLVGCLIEEKNSFIEVECRSKSTSADFGEPLGSLVKPRQNELGHAGWQITMR